MGTMDKTLFHKYSARRHVHTHPPNRTQTCAHKCNVHNLQTCMYARIKKIGRICYYHTLDSSLWSCMAMHDQNHSSNLTQRQSNNKGTHTLHTHMCIAACILVHRSRCVHPYCVHGARLFTHRTMHGCRNATQYACMLFARCSHCHTSKNLQISE